MRNVKWSRKNQERYRKTWDKKYNYKSQDIHTCNCVEIDKALRTHTCCRNCKHLIEWDLFSCDYLWTSKEFENHLVGLWNVCDLYEKLEEDKNTSEYQRQQCCSPLKKCCKEGV